MKTLPEIIREMRDGLDAMVTDGSSEPEWQKINAIRFMECYRVMRALDIEVDIAREEGVR